MLDKDQHRKAAMMCNFLCYYLKEQEKIDESEIVAALLYCIAIQSHNGKIKKANVMKTLSKIWSEVKLNLALMNFEDYDIPEA
tara:strand:+ start:1591 stop:1839 length:249 start_codon:yes stop_codon:yes gene_type:complete